MLVWLQRNTGKAVLAPEAPLADSAERVLKQVLGDHHAWRLDGNFSRTWRQKDAAGMTANKHAWKARPVLTSLQK